MDDIGWSWLGLSMKGSVPGWERAGSGYTTKLRLDRGKLLVLVSSDDKVPIASHSRGYALDREATRVVLMEKGDEL